MNKMIKKEEGFSLIELIIVIAILAIIAAIAVPNLIGNIRRANESTDEANAKLIYDAVNIAIGKNPTNAGDTFADQILGTSSETLMTEALNEFPGGTGPLLQSSTYMDGADDDFRVSIVSTASGSVVQIDDANGVQLYP